MGDSPTPSAIPASGYYHLTCSRTVQPHLVSSFRRSVVIAALVWASFASAQVLPQKLDDSLDISFAIPNYFQDYAAAGGNPRPEVGRLLLYLPKQFNPRGSYPVLAVTSTTDKGRTSTMDAPMYRAVATQEGWIVLATAARIRPKIDSTAWRAGVLAAGLDLMHRDWPASRTWPVVFAGLSGGAKRSCWMAAMLAQTKSVKMAGLFLAGMNEDRMGEAIHDYPTTTELLAAPIWMSCGRHDPIAPPEFQRQTQASLKHLGFRQVELSQFDGGHEVDPADLRRALRWFRTKGNF